MNVPWSPSRSYSPTKSLEDVLEQYVFFFTSNLGFPITDSNILLTETSSRFCGSSDWLREQLDKCGQRPESLSGRPPELQSQLVAHPRNHDSKPPAPRGRGLEAFPL
jgi:hypothetical protein